MFDETKYPYQHLFYPASKPLSPPSPLILPPVIPVLSLATLPIPHANPSPPLSPLPITSSLGLSYCPPYSCDTAASSGSVEPPNTLSFIPISAIVVHSPFDPPHLSKTLLLVQITIQYTLDPN